MSRLHVESHAVERIGWLRAAVLGANDGIISTASLILGVASAAASRTDILLTGVAGLVAGAMSMAAGEYVSVSSQSDTEHADLVREKRELAADPAFEQDELVQIYVARGLEEGLAREVAKQLMAKGCARRACARRTRDLGDHDGASRPSCACVPAATFSIGAAAPLMLVMVSPANTLIPVVAAGSLLFLAVLGAVGAKTGGAGLLKPTLRVTFWGAFAMALTAGIGVADIHFVHRLLEVIFVEQCGPPNARLGVEFLPTIDFPYENGPGFSLGFVPKGSSPSSKFRCSKGLHGRVCMHFSRGSVVNFHRYLF
jgi:VIT1/CCC1 family predicted Fe2+/Mn2+ transporter